MKLVPAFMLFLFSLVSPSLADPVRYKIGVLAPLTGTFANYGKIVREGIEKVRRSDVEWVFEDEGCEPAKAVTAFRKLVTADGVSFFIGPCCGSPQKAIAPLLPKGAGFMLLPNAAPASLFSISSGKMYSVQHSLDAEATFIANTMNLQGLKRTAVIFNDNDFSRALEQAFLKAYEGEVVYTERAPGYNVSYMKAAALKLRSIDFDSLFIPDAAPFLLGLLTEMKKAGIAKRPAFSVYSAQMPDVLAAEKENVEGLLYSYPDVPEHEDALGYFPAFAAKILAEKVSACKGALACVSDSFAHDSSFRSDGTLAGKIVLKTVRDGKFVRMPEPEAKQWNLQVLPPDLQRSIPAGGSHYGAGVGTGQPAARTRSAGLSGIQASFKPLSEQ